MRQAILAIDRSFTHVLPSLSAQVILRGTRSAGYGFVAMATEEAAQKAVELLDKKELDGRTVIVELEWNDWPQAASRA